MLLILGFSCSITWVQILAATFYHPQGLCGYWNKAPSRG
ncbi:hypothetical protein GLYMA_09G075251v4 [Glycine max]|nr:hypothetical protein GLYMA_09G075251v4 [Glycine max]KAH1041990.1 hypothetical protein GYH30_024349 [Glycine max]